MILRKALLMHPLYDSNNDKYNKMFPSYKSISCIKLLEIAFLRKKTINISLIVINVKHIVSEDV